MRLCKTTVEGILKTSATNDQAVLERTDLLWKTLEEVFVISKENFTSCANDFSKFREIFNKLVESQLPNEFQHLRENIKEALTNAESRFVNVENVVGDHQQKLHDFSSFCNKLQVELENVQKCVSKSNGDDNAHLQENLCNVNQNIRELHDKCHQHSLSITQIRENSLASEQTFVTRTEFMELQKQFAHVQHFAGELKILREEVQTSIQNVETRHASRLEALQRQADQILDQMAQLNSEIARCHSLIELKAHQPPKDIEGPQNNAELVAWTRQIHKAVWDITSRLQQMDSMVILHDKKLQHPEGGLQTSPGVSPADFQKQVDIIARLRGVFEHVSRQVTALEVDSHEVAVLKDSLVSLKLELNSKITAVETKLRSEIGDVQRFLSPQTNPFQSFGPKAILQRPENPPLAAHSTVTFSAAPHAQNLSFSAGNSFPVPVQQQPPPWNVATQPNVALVQSEKGLQPPIDPGQSQGGPPGPLPGGPAPQPTMVFPVGQRAATVAPLSSSGVENPPRLTSYPTADNTLFSANSMGSTDPPRPQGFSEPSAWPKPGSVFYSAQGPATVDHTADSSAKAERQPNPNQIVRSVDTTGGSGYTQKDNSIVTKISERMRPKWDGEPGSWKEFWKLWEYYYSLRKDSLDDNQEFKKLLFIECLPAEEAERARHIIIEGDVSFESLVQRYHANNTFMASRFQAEAAWRAFVPHDKKWRNVDLWFSKWSRMAAEIPDLSETQKKEQFDMIMCGFAPTVVKDYKKEELAGKAVTLQRRWELIANELSVHQFINQINSAYQAQHAKGADTSHVSAVKPAGHTAAASQPRSTTPPSRSAKRCFNCGEEGHVKADCPQPPQGGTSSRNSSRDSQRSTGSDRRDSRESRESRGRGKPDSRQRSFSRDVPRSGRGDISPPRGWNNSYSQGRQDSRQGSSYRRDSRDFKSPYSKEYGQRDSPKKREEGRISPYRSEERNRYQSRSSGGSQNSSEEREYYSDYNRRDRDRQKKPGIPSRSQLLERQRSNRCLTCGDSSHSTSACPTGHRGRSPTPRPAPRDNSRFRPRVEFRDTVARIQDEPLTSVREGDVDEADEQIVDAYLAARAISGYVSASDFE